MIGAVPVLLFSVLIVGFVWVFMTDAIFSRLKAKHCGQYKAMGEPSMFANNSMNHQIRLLMFLAARDHKRLGDRGLSVLCDLTLVVFALFLVLFIACFLSAGYPIL